MVFSRKFTYSETFRATKPVFAHPLQHGKLTTRIIPSGCSGDFQVLFILNRSDDLGEWHSLLPTDRRQGSLEQAVATMLTEPVTRTLPTAWHGNYTVRRAREWITERAYEGTTLLVIDKTTNEPVGLVILFEVDSDNAFDGIEVRLGYLLSEPAWGEGLATELVWGICRLVSDADTHCHGGWWSRCKPSSVHAGIGEEGVPSCGGWG